MGWLRCDGRTGKRERERRGVKDRGPAHLQFQLQQQWHLHHLSMDGIVMAMVALMVVVGCALHQCDSVNQSVAQLD